MPRLIRALFAAALAGVFATSSAAQDTLVRAINDQLSADAVHLMAIGAPAVDLRARAPGLSADVTVSSVIERICGSVHPAYVEVFRDVNGPEAPGLNDVVGTIAYGLIWPACLYVQPLDGFTVEVGERQTATGIFQTFTGGRGSQAQLTAFFGRTIAELNRLQPGDRLPVPYRTAAVPAGSSPGDGVALAAALSRLEGFVRGSRPYQPEERRAPAIVLGLIAGAPNGCSASGTTEPFNPEELMQALAFAKESRSGRRRQVSIAVVDNGFFGADADDGFDGSPFRSSSFAGDPNSVVRMRVNIGGGIEPLNDRTATPVGSTSGHGTHVAGLVLGGPRFRPHWDEVNNGDAWSELTIINVGKGQRTLVDGSMQGLFSPLTQPQDIVNMSVSYDDRNDEEMSQQFRALFSAHPATLFVVAAGNLGQPVGAVGALPATLGGESGANVVSVAAHDANHRLAPFSNFSPDTVDLAAPGCGLKSWLNNTSEETALDGTSQAAPLVSFAASLLKWARPSLSPQELKARLIVSGDLMLATDRDEDIFAGTLLADPEAGSDADKVVYRVTLNIPRALFFSQDYLRINGPDAGEYLGDFETLTVSCRQETFDERRIWAFKRETTDSGWLYTGRSDGRVHRPCPTQTTHQRGVEFVASHHVIDGQVQRLSSLKILRPPFSDVQDLITRSR